MIELLPNAQGSMVGRDGVPVPEWFDFFRALASSPEDVQAQIAALQALIAALKAQGGSSPAVLTTLKSLESFGTLADGQVWINLVNDADSPDPSSFYGTDPDGTRGWFSRLLSTLADVDVTGLADGDALAWDATAAAFVPSAPAGIPTFVAADKTFRVPATRQSLFAMPIDCEGYLDVEGYLIGVD